MHAAARNIGRRSSICSWMRTKPGQKTRLFSSFLFPGNFLITMTSRPLRILTMRERRGRISRCKVSIRVWWCMAWKGSITSAHAKNFESLMSFKSKQWRQSANLDGKNGCLKSCRPGKVRMIGANFPIAFSKDRLGPDRNYSQRHSPDQPNDQNLDPFQSKTPPAGNGAGPPSGRSEWEGRLVDLCHPAKERQCQTALARHDGNRRHHQWRPFSSSARARRPKKPLAQSRAEVARSCGRRRRRRCESRDRACSRGTGTNSPGRSEKRS